MYSTLSVASLGSATLPRKTPHVRREGTEDTLFVTVEERTNRVLNKPSTGMQLDNDDVIGAKSKVLHRERRGYTADVFTGYSRRSDVVCPDRMTTTERRVDPLAPQYRLPTFQRAASLNVPFLRDSFDVSDIEGTKSRPAKKFTVRDGLRVDDIEGADSRWRPLHA